MSTAVILLRGPRGWLRNAADLLLRSAFVCGLFLLPVVASFPANAVEPANGPPGRAVVVAAKIEQNGTATKLSFVSSLPLSATPFALEKPDRLVLDLPEVNFQLPAHTGESGAGLVKSFRFGLFGFGRSRVVIDLAGPAQVAAVTNAPLLKDLGTVFTIELAKSDRVAFHEFASASHATQASVDTAQKKPPNSQQDPRPLVVLDPGHGGFDPGAMGGDGEVEKTITLDFATTLAAELERRGKVRVALTRTTDTFVSLPDRVRFARDQNAALFVSVHADTLGGLSSAVRGATIYTLADKASDAEAEKLAEKENRVDQLAGLDPAAEDGDVVSILDDLMKRETKILSLAFAKKLAETLEPHVRLNKNPMRSAAFFVLKAPDVPSALVELGYLSSRADRAALTSQEWREQAARAMATAIETRLSAKPGAAVLAN
jgi:N-acetylmuramoyl-L-alanine amidase